MQSYKIMFVCCTMIKMFSFIKHRQVLYLLLLVCPFTANSQITVIQNFNFGAFYQGDTGGTITISTVGSRSSIGDIVLLNSGPSVSLAILEIEAPANSIISILAVPNGPLTGSNGGTMTLHIGGSNPTSPFISTAVPPARTSIHLSGTLSVGNRVVSPPGTYQGTFTITINYQ